MDRRALRLLLVPIALVVALAVAQVTVGVGADLLIGLPALLLALPLLAGRYVGEERLAELAARRAPARRRAGVGTTPTGWTTRLLPRGGRLIAASLAERGPPLLAG